jgi:BirA family biotin operon repressor/biotin-[acetyl-CoA-carboxylase] ligase
MLVKTLKTLRLERGLRADELAGAFGDPLEINAMLEAECLSVRGADDSWRLAHPVEWLDQRLIRAHCLGIDIPLTLIDETGSTQDDVEARLHLLERHEFVAVCAEHQSRGRGRQGRGWTNVIGSDILLSVGFALPEASGIAGVGLAAGVALRDAFPQARLKWPNDLVARDGAKIGGILCRAKRNGGGRLHVIAGIGINVRNPKGADRKTGRSVASLRDIGYRGGRNEACGRIITCIVRRIRKFAAEGFASLRDEWLAGALAKPGDRISYRICGDRVESGIFRGIGGNGELLTEGADGIRGIYSADVEDADSLH